MCAPERFPSGEKNQTDACQAHCYTYKAPPQKGISNRPVHRRIRVFKE
jgi:hypothetical protein